MAFTTSRTATFFVVFLLLGCTPILQSADGPTPTASITSPPVSPESSPESSPNPPKTVVSAQRVSPKPPLANQLEQATLTAQTATFTWGKPGGDRSEYREAKLSYPVVINVPEPELQDKIQDSISLKSAFGRSLTEMEAEFKEMHWLTSLDYAVNYNDNALLSLTYTSTGVSAYPSTFVRHRSVNLLTGSVLRAQDLFTTEGLGAIALQVDKQLQEAIKVQVSKLGTPNMEGIDPSIYKSHRFRIKNLNDFTITPDGIIFHYEFGFPHVLIAAEPKGDFLITYAQLKSYAKPSGPLLRLLSSTGG
ncbi:MAG: hypothetical protein NT070_12455 [Cyanobacteria bacterium]|nr:hypothetical protein [Cyanobacteriota bacterium]